LKYWLRLKARTAVAFKRPTKAMEEMISGGRSVFWLSNLTPIQGGLPVMVEGRAIAGIGVSGVRSSRDEQVAQAGNQWAPEMAT
jgi:uncharacterized protein GlcG (DUF336 family)